MSIFYQSSKYTVKQHHTSEGVKWFIVENFTGREMMADDCPAPNDDAIESVWNDYVDMVLRDELEEYFHVTILNF